MRAHLVFENINFERGEDLYRSLRIGQEEFNRDPNNLAKNI